MGVTAEQTERAARPGAGTPLAADANSELEADLILPSLAAIPNGTRA